MAAEFSTYGATQILDGVALPTTLYLQLHIGNPGAAGASNAAAETTRKSFTRDPATAGVTAAAATLSWSGVAAAETYSHWTAWDALTAGNCWAVGDFASPVAVSAAGNFSIPDGDFDLSIAVWS